MNMFMLILMEKLEVKRLLTILVCTLTVILVTAQDATADFRHLGYEPLAFTPPLECVSEDGPNQFWFHHSKSLSIDEHLQETGNFYEARHTLCLGATSFMRLSPQSRVSPGVLRTLQGDQPNLLFYPID
jgi:hypothetical protein